VDFGVAGRDPYVSEAVYQAHQLGVYIVAVAYLRGILKSFNEECA
jgi:N-acetylmuramic acid 6-phosphate (MurNAc-6-P) etherase